MPSALSSPISCWSCFLAIFTAVAIALSVPATAEAKIPSNAELFEMVKALQDRVVALERENEQLRRGAIVHAGLKEEAPLHLSRTTYQENSNLTDRPVNVGEEQNEKAWSGWYWGASFGAGKTKAENVIDVGTSNNNQLGIAGPDDNGGALIDLYVGRSWQIHRRLIMGLQLEGTLAALDFDSRGLFFGGFGGPPSQYVSAVESDWMVSALGRAGILLGPKTMLYGVAGWTYAHFSADIQFIATTGFDSDAPTYGAGFERRLDSNWALSAEYRRTDFGEEDVPFSTNINGFVRDGEDRFSNEMHIGRVGIKRYLNGGS